MKKNILITIFVLTFGLCVGYFAGKFHEFLRLHNLLNNYESQLQSNSYYAEAIFINIDRAHKAYLTEKTEIGIWELEGTILTFENLLPESTGKTLIAREDLHVDLMVSHARLSKLFSKLKNFEKENFHIQKSIEYSRLLNNEYKKYKTIELIMELVEKLDNNYINNINTKIK